MSESPKRHHFVPQVYLRAWANQNDQVSARRRRGQEAFVTSVKNVALENGLHGSGESAQAREHELGVIEERWPDLRTALLSPRTLSPTLRSEVADFVALQLGRTRDSYAKADFFERAAAAIVSRPIDRADMETFLCQDWGIAQPRPGKIAAATDLLTALISMQGSDEFPKLRAMDDPGYRQDIKQHLLTADWRVERSHSPDLITSDTPVTLWRPRSEMDLWHGLGVLEATEVWLPIDPRHLLVIAPRSGKRGVWGVGSKRFRQVNQEIGSRCYEAVFGRHNGGHYLAELSMAPTRPALRFNGAPGYSDSKDEPSRYLGDVIQTWVPSHDGV